MTTDRLQTGENYVGHYPNTALFNNPKKKTSGSRSTKLFIGRILVDLYTELSRQEIGHTILVTHLDRLKYRKNSSRCHKIKYRKV